MDVHKKAINFDTTQVQELFSQGYVIEFSQQDDNLELPNFAKVFSIVVAFAACFGNPIQRKSDEANNLSKTHF